MSNREEILQFVSRFPGRDDDEISATLKIKPRQTVNQICRTLAAAGLVTRRTGPSGKLANFPSTNRTSPPIPLPSDGPTNRSSTNSAAATEDWYWEGNVVNALSAFLESDGWTIVSIANAETRERGIDLEARRGSQHLLIEAKGYPSRGYRDPRRANEVKPTNPTLQAGHWFAHALLKALRLRSVYPDATPAIGLPDFPRYRSLGGEIAPSLQALGILVFFVAEDGAVDVVGLARPGG